MFIRDVASVVSLSTLKNVNLNYIHLHVNKFGCQYSDSNMHNVVDNNTIMAVACIEKKTMVLNKSKKG